MDRGSNPRQRRSSGPAPADSGNHLNQLRLGIAVRGPWLCRYDRLLAVGMPAQPSSGPVVRRAPEVIPLPNPLADPRTTTQEPGGDIPTPASITNQPSLLSAEFAPIDLPSAVRLAGLRNPDLFLARQRVVEAAALRQLAAAQLLPNLNVGTNFDSHSGPLQQSNGNILRVSRSALYAGAGANAVAAGTVNIPGVQWNLNVSNAIFGILVSRQVVARNANSPTFRPTITCCKPFRMPTTSCCEPRGCAL